MEHNVDLGIMFHYSRNPSIGELTRYKASLVLFIKDCIICWKFLYLSQKFEEIEDAATRRVFLGIPEFGWIALKKVFIAHNIQFTSPFNALPCIAMSVARKNSIFGPTLISTRVFPFEHDKLVAQNAFISLFWQSFDRPVRRSTLFQ
jgi:hypothetical protein